MPWLLLLGSLVCTDPAYDPVARERVAVVAADAHQGSLWAWGWGGVLGVSTVGQLTLAAWVHDEGFRIDRAVGGVTSLVGVLAVITTRPRAMSARRDLGPCPTREALDAAFERVAAEERFGQAWYQHVLGAAFNLAAGLYLGLAHDRWLSGALQTVSGTAVSQLMIRTRPTRVAHLTVLPVVGAASDARSLGLSLSARF